MTLWTRQKKYRPNRITEDMVESYLVKRVESMGGICQKGNPKNQRGMHDRICIVKNLVVFVELKRPGRKPRPNQRLMSQRFKSLGQHSYWCNSYEMIDVLIDWMKKHIATMCSVPTTKVCYRPECKERVEVTWIEYLGRRKT